MIDKDFFTIVTEHFTIEGRSRAGQETFFRVRDLGLVLDIGRGPDLAVQSVYEMSEPVAKLLPDRWTQ